MNDELYEKDLEDLAEVLSAVYRRVKWYRMHNSNPHDVFQHRIRGAATRMNFSQFLAKLCDGLGVQSVKSTPGLIKRIRRLNSRSRQALALVRKEHILLVAEATARARAYKERLREVREQGQQKGVKDE